MTEWWRDKGTEVGDFECEDHYYRCVCAREVDGEWEYAIVHWRYGNASLHTLLRGGKIVEKVE